MKRNPGFTLIELLIVVAIIGILAAIAIPNFLQAQVRAKVARAKADMTTLATGMESYAVDYNVYPRGSFYQLATNCLDFPGTSGYNMGLILLSTPVDYISQGLIDDPFPPVGFISGSGNTYNFTNLGHRYYGYSGRSTLRTVGVTVVPDNDTVDNQTIWWVLQSSGPDRFRRTLGGAILTSGNEQAFRDTIYDPTNGTVSQGCIFRAGGGPSGVGSFAFQIIQESVK